MSFSGDSVPGDGEDATPRHAPDEDGTDSAAESDDAEYRVAPLTPEDEAVAKLRVEGRRAEIESQAMFRPIKTEDDKPESIRYTAQHLLILTTVAAVLLAGIRFVPIRDYTFALGLLVALSMILGSLLKIRHPLLFVGWWVLLGVYLTVAIATIIQQNMP